MRLEDDRKRGITGGNLSYLFDWGVIPNPDPNSNPNPDPNPNPNPNLSYLFDKGVIRTL